MGKEQKKGRKRAEGGISLKTWQQPRIPYKKKAFTT